MERYHWLYTRSCTKESGFKTKKALKLIDTGITKKIYTFEDRLYLAQKTIKTIFKFVDANRMSLPNPGEFRDIRFQVTQGLASLELFLHALKEQSMKEETV